MMPVFYYSYTKWVALSSKCTLTENHENQIMCDGKKLLSLFINANLTCVLNLHDNANIHGKFKMKESITKPESQKA